MKTLKIVTLISIAIVLITSCVRDDGNNPTSYCLDSTFYALRTNDVNNSNQEVELVGTAYSSNAQNSVPVDLFTLNTSDVYGGNKSAYNSGNENFYFFDEFNGGQRMIKAGTNPPNLSVINFTTGLTYTAPVIDGGVLYALEKDYATGDLNLVTINQNTGVSTRITTSPILNFDLAGDAYQTKCFATSNDNGRLYFLGDKLMTIDVSGSTLIFNYFNRPSNANYMDIVYQHDAVDLSISSDGLFVAMHDSATNFNGIVHWNLTTGTAISEIVIINNLDFNPEVTSLDYNVCGDRLVALSNFVYNGTSNDISKIYDIKIPNDVLTTTAATLVGTQVFSEFYFGFIHKD